jgi:hypothetical protein
MRIRVEEGEARRELVAFLSDRGCVALPVGQTLEILDREPLSVRFFLRAWQVCHPDAQLQIL